MYGSATGKGRLVEEEALTEQNVYSRPDETVGFFSGQLLKDRYVSAFLLIACVVLSCAAPAPLTEPANRPNVENLRETPRPG